jgi:FkbM family methyltransferase
MLQILPRLAVDIGGNIGNYTAELRKKNLSLEIHTFEPSTTNIEKLRYRFRNDSLIKLVPLALSDEAGSATLFSNEPGSGLASLTKRRLDHFRIPFEAKEVKIDIEGHELAALKGFGAALEAVRVLQFEFGGCNIDTRTYFQDFWYFFKEQNFDIYRITPLGTEKISRYKESDEYFTTTNYIAANRRQTSSL